MARVERGQRRTDVLCHMLMGVMFLGLGAAALAEQAALTGRPVVDPAIESYVASTNVSGAIVITGSETMYPIMVKMASAFRQWQPDIKLAVQGGGSDAALRSFLQDQAFIRRGDADPHPKGHMVSGSIALLASSRPLTSEERKEFQSRYGYEPTEIPVAVDTIALYVNSRNPIQGLTLAEVDAIFGRDRKRGFQEKITTWGQVGLTGEWERQPIKLYGRDKQSGTRTFFINEVLLGGELNKDVQEEKGVALEILAISRDLLGIGYAGIGFQASTVRVVPLAERAGMPYVTPSTESAANGTYPLSRSLYLYVRKAPGSELEPALLEFLKFANSRQGQDAVVKAGAYALSASQVATNFRRLTGRNASASAVLGGAN